VEGFGFKGGSLSGVLDGRSYDFRDKKRVNTKSANPFSLILAFGTNGLTTVPFPAWKCTCQPEQLRGSGRSRP